MKKYNVYYYSADDIWTGTISTEHKLSKNFNTLKEMIKFLYELGEYATENQLKPEDLYPEIIYGEKEAIEPEWSLENKPYFPCRKKDSSRNKPVNYKPASKITLKDILR